MCGIFGIAALQSSGISPSEARSMLSTLFLLSESRGKESAGIALRSSKSIYVHKSAVSASELLKSPAYYNLLDRYLKEVYSTTQPLMIMGHARLVTDGAKESNRNNQPVIKDGIVGIHNGIVTNVDFLFAAHREIERTCEVDTEIILGLMSQSFKKERSLFRASQATFSEIEGAASIALLFEDLDHLFLATNTGSLYICRGRSALCFASERYIIETFAKKYSRNFDISTVKKVQPGEAISVNLTDLSLQQGACSGTHLPLKETLKKSRVLAKVNEIMSSERRGITKRISNGKPLGLVYTPPTLLKVKRCTKCILPATVPRIEFDEEGVCNYCRSYKRMKLKGKRSLVQDLQKFRSRDKDQPDCIVAFSGGRDSSYGLDYIKRELGLNPIAFTYDWGMVTDLARRNQARLCGKLGVEHILVSADIDQKRENIRKNVNAWLKAPDLGMVPLFMAGDKMFFHYAHILRKQTRTKVVVFCAGGEYETTDFKQGFCGVGAFEKKTMTALSFRNKMRILAYYLKQYLRNPAYINASIVDTLFAYYSMFVLKDDYIYLYDYIDWDESVIDKLLITDYGWELAKDTESTWRIGDGTAAFYNYIYYTVAGFTEFDYFRSAQIRRGVLTREQALSLVAKDNKPREESLRWYGDIVGFDLKRAIGVINTMPKRYGN
jgi:glutamine---fructose-6-phosphate transaminase (isomerizing)